MAAKKKSKVKTKAKRRAARPTGRRIEAIAVEAGALRAKMISPSDVETGQWVRWRCQFGCGGYNSSLVCPPHSPPPEKTRKMLDEYERAVFFESPPDQVKEIAVKIERELFLMGYYKALSLGAGPCTLCKTCAFDEGCRHPRQARPAMEACGIDVFATARKHGFTIEVVRKRSDPQHYFGMVLIE